MFFAERAGAKVDGLKVKPVPIKKVGIVGAGLMGGGIGMSCAEVSVMMTSLVPPHRLNTAY
jgi:3-hydroxyacyl-CoA dehydrogenase